MEDESQGEMALEESQGETEGPEEMKEVQETEMRARLGGPQVVRVQEDERDVGDQTHHQLPHDHAHPQGQRAHAPHLSH